MRARLPATALVVAAVCCGGAAVAHAEPPSVALMVESTCPDGAQVRAALPASVAIADAGADAAGVAFELRVARDGDVVRVWVRTAAGAEVMRELRGHDCAALAEAIGLIIDGMVLELTVPEAPPPPPSPPAREPAPPPLEPAPVAAKGAEPARLGLGLSAGFARDLSADGDAGAPLAGLDLSWRSPWRGLRLRVHVGVGGAATLPRASRVA